MSINEIQTWIIEKICQNLELSEDQIDIDEPFSNFGVSSVHAVMISGELAKLLGKDLSPTLLYEYPTIHKIAEFVADNVKKDKEYDINNRQSHLSNPDIAIIGIGCRFPGADGPDSFWDFLLKGKDAVRQLENERWHGKTNNEKIRNKLSSIRWGGFIDNIEEFDAGFFGISPREAHHIDPQQRILLEVAWEALENAGQVEDEYVGSNTGVFIGVSSNDYSHLERKHESKSDPYAGTGNATSIVANRLSYFFDFQGPSIAVDTACSSSLVSVHLAVQELRYGNCNLALAGGVNLLIRPEPSLIFSSAGMLAKDGKCKTFDALADGYVRGEGAGIVVLKRLEDAQKDGDNILAVIKGSAINQDGRTNGLTAPNGLLQEKVIREALRNARVKPSQIGYIETHGTGTELGDPIEVKSIINVLNEGRDWTPCVLGAVKTNIGHLEAAAGIAGLIKTILILKHGEIPPNLHFKNLNPKIDIDNTPFEIPTERMKWVEESDKRLAGISSFGFGGTNAHVILKEPPALSFTNVQAQGLPSLFTLSAKSEAALKLLIEKYVQKLQENSNLNLQNLCYTVNTRRSAFKYRIAFTASSQVDLMTKLQEARKDFTTKQGTTNNSQAKIPVKTAFLFTGQASLYPRMAEDLYKTNPVFRDALNRCSNILSSQMDCTLLDIIYGSHEDKLLLTSYAQVVLFSIEYSLVEMLKSCGIEPDCVMGHSVGEYAAALTAGIISLEDGLKLIAARGRLMQSLEEKGKMLAVFLPANDLEPYLMEINSENICIAAFNGPGNCVVSGGLSEIENLKLELAKQSVRFKELEVSHAFHSPLMRPILDEFREIAVTIQYARPKILFISTVNGKLYSVVPDAEYWCEHILRPVQFISGMNELRREGVNLFWEIGPKSDLITLSKSFLNDKDIVWLPVLRQSKPDYDLLLENLGKSFVKGTRIDWKRFYNSENYPLVHLPNYPFIREKYWIEDLTAKDNDHNNYKRGIVTSSLKPFVGFEVYSPLLHKNERQFENILSIDEKSFLNDHRIFNQVIFPASAYVEMAFEASNIISPSPVIELTDIRFQRALPLSGSSPQKIQLLIQNGKKSEREFGIYSFDGHNPNNASWFCHVEGKISKTFAREVDTSIDFKTLISKFTQEISVAEFYSDYHDRGMHYGKWFQAVRELWRNGGQVIGLIELAQDLNNKNDFIAHPALLDACMQVVAASINEKSDKFAYLPIAINRIFMLGRLPSQIWSCAEVVSIPDADSNVLSVNFKLFTKEGELISKIEGLKLKRTSGEAISALQKGQHRDMLYDIKWEPWPYEGPVIIKNQQGTGTWLIFTDKEAFGDNLANIIREKGGKCIIVRAGINFELINEGIYEINPESKLHFSKLFENFLKADHTNIDQIVHCWNMDNNRRNISGLNDLKAGLTKGIISLLNLLNSIKLSSPQNTPGLTIITNQSISISSAKKYINYVQFPDDPRWYKLSF